MVCKALRLAKVNCYVQDQFRRNGEKDEELVERRQVVLDNIRDNDEAGAHYRQVLKIIV
jgi:hypothetical protein